MPAASSSSGSVRGLALRGAFIGPKIRVRKKKPKDALSPDVVVPAFVAIPSVDALVKELRKGLHSMFSTLDTNLAATNLYENCSQQAFRFFTTTNTITPEAFHHKINKLGLHASRNVCLALFRLVDQEDLGELTYATFAHRIFLPAGYFNFSKPTTPTPRPLSASSRKDRLGSVSQGAAASSSEAHAGEGETGTTTLSIGEILATLRHRLEQQAAHNEAEANDRLRQAQRIFGKSSGITLYEFHMALATTLGLPLREPQVRELFQLFDLDKSGDLDLNEFVQGVLLDDASTVRHWFSIKDRQRVEEARRLRYSMAVQSVQHAWTIADIERMLREKIEQRTSRSSDCFRQAYRIFGKVNGIRPHEFHAALETIGLALEREQSDTLFRRFDQNGSGDIDLDEFIHAVLPPDYTGRQWVAAADELHREAALKKKQDAMLHPDRYMTEIEMENWSLDEIERRIRDKIQQATSKSSDTFRQAYKIFKKCNHVTIDDFRESLLALGFRLTPAQCKGLFRRYDTNNSNDIDLQEFCLRILPPDYTGDGDHWSHSEKFIKQRQRDKLEYVKRTKNGLLLLPTFDEARVRYTRGHHDVAPAASPASPPTTPRAHAPSRPSTPSKPPTSPRSPDVPAAASPRPMSPRVSRMTSSSETTTTSSSTPTSPRQPTSPRPPPHQPLSPRHPSSESPRRPTTPRPPAPPPSALSSPPTSPRSPRCVDDEDEADAKIVDDTTEWDDEADEHATAQALRVVRARRVEAAARHRHHHRHGAKTHRDGASVSGESTASFSSTVQRAVGGAKFTPTRSNTLLLQRFMRVANSQRQQAGGATTTQKQSHKATRPKRPHTTRP